MSVKRYPFSDFVNVTPVQARKSGSGRELQTFQSGRLWLPQGARGVFGGQVIAQALSAASHTVQLPLGLHSQHCYFLLPADASIPINYEVERLRDGKSYATRLVKAIQRDKPVFILAASYTLPPITLPKCPKKPDAADVKEAVSHSLRFALGNASESGHVQEEKSSLRTKKQKETDDIQSPFGFTPRFQIPFPDDVLCYEECEREENRWVKFLTNKPDLDKRGRHAIEEYVKERQESPVAIAVAKLKQTRDEVIAAGGNNRMLWMKARLQPGEKPSVETVKAMIAYISDFQFIGVASRAVGLTRVSAPRLGMLASLDHSTHFYPLPPNFDPSSPMLHVMEGVITDVASGRGVVRGLIYTQDGVLIATTLQEGVVRADTRGKKEKGLVEGRGLGEEREADGSVKAKL